MMAGTPDEETDNELLERGVDKSGIEGFDHDDLDDIELTPVSPRKVVKEEDDPFDDDESDLPVASEPNAGNKVVGYDPTKDQRRKAM